MASIEEFQKIDLRIGKSGQRLKQIGQAARAQIEQLMGGSVFVELWIKVAKDWRNDPVLVRQLGYGDVA